MRSFYFAAALLSVPAFALAQGSLTPSGAPAATMKTLTQIEPRTPLEDGIPGLNREANGGFTIQNPGSYYLTGRLTVTSGDAITINSSGVTLDLGGFTIASSIAGTAGSAITTASGASGITIRSGFIRGGVTSTAGGFVGNGFLHGITATNTHNVRVEDVTVQGMVGNGITLASGSGLIRSCAARLCGGTGLRANQVIDSQARQCGSTAIFAGTAPDAGTPILLPVPDGTASNCYGESLTGSPGIFASVATNCYGISDSGSGISARSATSCYGQSLSGHGVDSTTATGCQGYSYYSTGLSTGTATNCYGSSNSGWGLYAQESTNCHGSSQSGTCGLHAANTASGCTGLVNTATIDGTVGLFAANAENCRGEVTSGYTSSLANVPPCTGLEATVATNCTGIVVAFSDAAPMKFAYGLAAKNAGNCSGSAPAGYGLFVSHVATNCIGTIPWVPFVASGTENDCGLYASNATGCIGSACAGEGLHADTATDCRGSTVNGANGLLAESTAANCYGGTNTGSAGLRTFGTASFCRGYNGVATGTAVSALIAVACTAEKGVISILAGGSKQLGTP